MITDMSADKRLAELGMKLPPAMAPAGSYRTIAIVNNLAYLSGQGPVRADGSFVTGRVPSACSMTDAIAAGRLTGLNALAQIHAHFGTLDKVAEVIRIFGLIYADDGFADHPKVLDGFSDLMVEVFGEAGKGVRCAVGAHSLPFNTTIEVEMMVRLHD